VRHDDEKFEETPDIRVLQRDIRAKSRKIQGTMRLLLVISQTA
jgi:hypothetical protein